MRVYLLRHGTAEDSPPAGGTDDDRELTADGITKLKRCAPGLRRLVDAEVVLTSPLRRSAHTAAIVGKILSLEVMTFQALAPGGARREVFRALQDLPEDAGVVLVGHNPDLSLLVPALLGLSSPVLELRKGGMCRIDVENLSHPRGLLIWALTPDLLRAVKPKR
jgi:phosphohistidine phosphatase